MAVRRSTEAARGGILSLGFIGMRGSRLDPVPGQPEMTKAKNHSILGDPASILHTEEHLPEQRRSARHAHPWGDHAEDDSIG